MSYICAIICTHNRDFYLGDAIDSLLTQKCEDYEILVIDNASTDDTKKVVESRLNNPLLRYVYEPNLGLSHARNRGATETDATILAYLDDDAIAPSNWLQTLINAYKNNEKLAIAGGKVTLIWPENRSQPWWLSDELSQGLGYYDLGNQEITITAPNLTPRGLNYSVRKSFLEDIGGFDVNLGRKGKNLLSNEELFLTELAIKNGWEVRYLPHALVQHNVAPERMTMNWFFNRSWWQGISEAYREEVQNNTGISQITRGGERLIRGLYKSLKYINQPAQSFDNLIYAYGQIGYLSRVMTYQSSQIIQKILSDKK